MSTETTYAALLAAALVAAAAGWRLHGNRAVGALLVVLAAALPACVVATSSELATDAGARAAVLVTTGLVAVLGGGPVTAAVFRVVDGRAGAAPGSVGRAAEVLRGGAWIGSLERLAVFAALACGWPEGLALTLALKGLGRYPELRHEERPGIAERFLIGTFVSVLWACAWAGTAHLLL